MPKIKIEITETLQKTIEVDAENEHEAYKIVKEKYRNSEIILDDTSYIDTEFEVVE
jgi:hypothetical protein